MDNITKLSNDDNNINKLLLDASYFGKKDTVIELLNKNADIETRNKYWQTPLIYAVESFNNLFSETIKTIMKGNKNVIIEFLKSCPEFQAINKNGETPLTCSIDCGSWTISRNKNCIIDVIVTLLNRNANIEAKNEYDETPLYIASKNGIKDIVTILLNHNANIMTTYKENNTPLHIASKYGKYNVV